MRKQLPLLVLLFLPLLAWAQAVTVPKNVYFADIHLKISDGAQQEIQKKVDALHRNQTYFRMKVDLADAYFPIIERVFKEEGVPDDYKYLALQESGLVGDAISTSNAVGYWQFKKEAASDFNLRMDNKVDERRHIIEASRGAAKYFKRSNVYYNNWFNSLLSYYLGPTGAKSYTNLADKGAKKMDVTEKSHQYVLTFLAHKIAYDNFVGKNTPPAISLREMRGTPGQSLGDIALATRTDYAELERYNKWLLGNSIPSDKDYYVMVPIRSGSTTQIVASNTTTQPSAVAKSVPASMAAAAMVKRNNLNALIAREGDTKDRLALQAGVSTRKFLKYNDMRNFDKIEAGAAYYVEPKHSSAQTEFHVVQPGENMQQISQHYGIKLQYLQFKNRMGRNEVPLPGRVLWLQKRRPASTPVEVRDLSQKQAASTQPTTTTAPTTVKSTPAKVATAKADAPKENFFTRFINSFKRKKAAPAEAAPVLETPVAEAPVTETEPVAPTEVFVEPAIDPNANKSAMYPGQRTLPATNTTPANTASAPVASGEAEIEDITPEDEGAFTETATAPAPKPAVVPVKKATPAPASNKTVAVTPAKTDTTPVSRPVMKAAKHAVQKGETLYGISRIYAVTVADLVAWNNLTDQPLKLGQELIIAEPLNVPAQQQQTTSTPAAVTGTHTVLAGETLYQISKKYNVSLQDLSTWNNLVDNAIKPGQELRLTAPAGEEEVEEETSSQAVTPIQGESMYHTVASGESMYQISRKYGVTIKDLMEWNNKSDFNVKPGDKLLVKRK
ncbi:LysM peptidoglycan-binding domain-containing protein [Pontibacter arcticus]|uniref:Lytic transglycosylase n=1 Tax=Pontibacter arcticus TaxID=2080288 RepID=A0A364RHA5_9BACT|nr:LysM peptidoglycan-binding domain-containing protein [Pontibacter arcticus]RAU83720.1 lytic transglycosylase [Pontibacter arcticus]